MNNPLPWPKRQLRDCLVAGLGLSPSQINAIADRLDQTLANKRLALVPTYLGDEMFDAQREVDPDLCYSKANGLYTSAVKAYIERSIELATDAPEPVDVFW
jgi:hypothetical protein